MCDAILYTWFGKKEKRLKKFWRWKICLVYVYFFKHLSLSMLISFMLIFICSSDKLHFWAIFEFLGVKDEMKKNEMILFIIQEEMKKNWFFKDSQHIYSQRRLERNAVFYKFCNIKTAILIVTKKSSKNEVKFYLVGPFKVLLRLWFLIVTFHEIVMKYESGLKTQLVLLNISTNHSVGLARSLHFKFCQMIYLLKTSSCSEGFFLFIRLVT